MPGKAKPPVAAKTAAAIRRALAKWFRRDGRDLPWRRTRDPYAILVSEFMCQQTQVATVVPYYERWMARFPTFAALAAATEDDALSLWQGLGYYSRASNLRRAAQKVVESHGGVLPAEAAAIRALPGVGEYTAGAVAGFAFDMPVVTIDGNIARVLARLFEIREPIDAKAGAEKVRVAAVALLPARGGCLYTSSIMELGALICTPRSPRCPACPVRAHCQARDPESLPAKKPRRKTVAIDENCAWIATGARVLIERQTGPRWRGLWKLPALAAAPDAEPLTALVYPFTHHRVTLRIFAAPAPRRCAENQRWFSKSELPSVALAAPHRRAIECLLRAR